MGTACAKRKKCPEPVDQRVPLACAVTIGADGIDVDFAGTSPVCEYGVNVPLTYAQAYASFGARCAIGNDVPNNAGSLGVLRVTAPGGCILNAPRPAAVSARHAVGQMLPDVVLDCLEAPLGARSIEHGTCLSGDTLRLMQEKGTWFVPTLITTIEMNEEQYDHVLRLRGSHMVPRLEQAIRSISRNNVSAAEPGFGSTVNSCRSG